MIDRFWLAFVLAVGCGGEEPPQLRTELFVDACESLFACGCSDLPYTDEAHCQTVLAADLAGLEAAARAAGLTFEPACAAVELPIVRFGCRSAGELQMEPPACQRCAPVHGELPLGSICVDYGGFSACAQGLECDPESERCVDPCALPAGLPCGQDNRVCGPGTLCDFIVSGDCQLAPGVGERCVSYQCAEGLECVVYEDNGGECVDLPALGEACVDLCSDGLCVDDTGGELACIPAPSAGEPCRDNFFCGGGLYCEVPANVCRLPPGLGESCAKRPCAGGWICEDQRCVRGPPRVCERP